MKEGQPRTIYLADYEPPAFLIEETRLRFELWDTHTIVRSNLTIKRNQHETAAENASLQLDGIELVFCNEKYICTKKYSEDVQ